MDANATLILEASAQRLFPNASLSRVLAELLLERAQKNLIKYQTAARLFEARYGRAFDDFRQQVIETQPDSRTEQDYYDWELAVTGSMDMAVEITRIQGALQQL
jgi:hypothetical protein